MKGVVARIFYIKFMIYLLKNVELDVKLFYVLNYLYWAFYVWCVWLRKVYILIFRFDLG